MFLKCAVRVPVAWWYSMTQLLLRISPLLSLFKQKYYLESTNLKRSAKDTLQILETTSFQGLFMFDSYLIQFNAQYKLTSINFMFNEISWILIQSLKLKIWFNWPGQQLFVQSLQVFLGFTGTFYRCLYFLTASICIPVVLRWKKTKTEHAPFEVHENMNSAHERV